MARLSFEDGARGRCQPDGSGPGFRIRQDSPLAVHVLPAEPQRLGLARPGVEQEAYDRDGSRVAGFSFGECAAQGGILAVAQVVRLEAGLVAPQSAARVRVLGAGARASPRASSGTTAPPVRGSPIPPA